MYHLWECFTYKADSSTQILEVVIITAKKWVRMSGEGVTEDQGLFQEGRKRSKVRSACCPAR